MKMNKLMSLAIAFALLAVSFAMIENRHSFIMENASGQTTDWDNGTTLTVNAKYPKVYWIGFNNTTAGIPPAATPASSEMGRQVDVGNTYLFTFEYNYSFGSANCSYTVRAWYDTLGAYPASPNNSTRNLAFEIQCQFNGAYAILYPSGNLEVVKAAGSANVTPVGAPSSEQHYQVCIPVTFGDQLRAAEVNGNPSFGYDPLVPPFVSGNWDFSVTVRDTTSAATNITYGEFGIKRYVSTSVSGNPVGNAPPGGNTGWITVQSAITYSSNANYTLTVTVANLIDATIPFTIGRENITVQNVHPDNITGPTGLLNPTNFTLAGTPLNVWGPAMLASNNGTLSMGPLDSNYNSPGTTTNLRWRVNVPAGTPEGVYTATIYITVDAS